MVLWLQFSDFKKKIWLIIRNLPDFNFVDIGLSVYYHYLNFENIFKLFCRNIAMFFVHEEEVPNVNRF